MNTGNSRNLPYQTQCVGFQFQHIRPSDLDFKSFVGRPKNRSLHSKSKTVTGNAKNLSAHLSRFDCHLHFATLASRKFLVNNSAAAIKALRKHQEVTIDIFHRNNLFFVLGHITHICFCRSARNRFNEHENHIIIAVGQIIFCRQSLATVPQHPPHTSNDEDSEKNASR